LKVLPFAATMDAKQLQRFRNEAMAAASLRHENIVHVYGVGCERSVHFYAMELIDGQTLAEIIPSVHRQPGISDSTSAFEPAGAEAPTAPVGALSTEFSGAKGRELYRSETNGFSKMSSGRVNRTFTRPPGNFLSTSHCDM